MSRNVRPVGAGKLAVGASLGGPLFTNLGPPIPAPVVSVNARYGLFDKTNLDGGLLLTPAAAQGLDLGIGQLVLDQSGGIPAVMVGGRLTFFANALALSGRLNPNTGKGYDLQPRLYEEVYGTASWKVHEQWLLWAGVDLFAQIGSRFALVPSILAGAEWRFAREFGLSAELRQIAFASNQEYAVVAFIGPANYGALAANIGFTWYPGAEQ